MQIIYQELDYNNTDEIYAAAKIHESTPLNWNPSMKVTEEEIAYSVKKINESKDTKTVFILFAKLASGEIVGLHWLRLYERHNEQVVNIDSLWVNEKLRKNGIATELKRRGEDWGRSKGAKLVTTNVFCENEIMMKLNLKLGFKPDSIRMSKSLV